MVFEHSNVSFQILDVLYFEQKILRTVNQNRNFDALSFRIEADTVIETAKQQIELGDNSVCFFPSGVSYSRTTKKDRFIVIHFKTFNYSSNEIEFFCPSDCEKYKKLFEEILACWNGKAISYKYEAASVLNRIFAELYKDNKPESESSSKILQSIFYMKKNFMKKDFSLQLAAEKSLVSETYFRRLFKREFGCSPKRYIINRRIDYAATLIMAGYFSLSEVAEECGYEDYKHFSVEFKKLKGVSPKDYRYSFDHK